MLYYLKKGINKYHARFQTNTQEVIVNKTDNIDILGITFLNMIPVNTAENHFSQSWHFVWWLKKNITHKSYHFLSCIGNELIIFQNAVIIQWNVFSTQRLFSVMNSELLSYTSALHKFIKYAFWI